MQPSVPDHPIPTEQGTHAMSLSEKVVLVTGASRGIGRAAAQLCAERAARVAVHYNQNREAAEDTLSTLRGIGHSAFRADLSDPEAARRLVESVIVEMGTIDVLVNCAGIYELHPIRELTYDEWVSAWNRTLGVNLLGTAHVSFCTARHMIEHNGGRIITISSRGAFRGEPDAPAYGASKAGINAFSQSMAKALAPHRVFVFALAPGWVETDMTEEFLRGPAGPTFISQSPLRRASRPEEIANIIAYLASDAPEYMTGCIIDANGASYLRT